ncbi:211_t:CDS:2, partial [Gigaspora rosea]
EDTDNFISRIYTGEVDIYAWPMFNEITWYTTLDKLKKNLVCDWSSLDEAIIIKRVSTLKRLFITAISMGIEQLEPSIHKLLIEEFKDISGNGDSNKNIKLLLPKELKNKIINSSFPKDSKLLLYKNDIDLNDISRKLIDFFNEHIMDHENTNYEIDHNDNHKCFTDHKCHFICQLDDKHREQNVDKGLCRYEAGHDEKHLCDKIRHKCGKPCYLSDKKNCDKYCTNEVGHTEEIEHTCSLVHKCDIKISFLDSYCNPT